MQPFVLHTNARSHTGKSEAYDICLLLRWCQANILFIIFRKKLGALKPTVADIDSALAWMVSKDIRRKISASFDDAKTWLQTLHKVMGQLIVDVPRIAVRIMSSMIFFPLVLSRQRHDGAVPSRFDRFPEQQNRRHAEGTSKLFQYDFGKGWSPSVVTKRGSERERSKFCLFLSGVVSTICLSISSLSHRETIRLES